MSLEKNVNEGNKLLNKLDGALMYANDKIFYMFGYLGIERTTVQKALFSTSMAMFTYNLMNMNIPAGVMGYFAYRGLENAETTEEKRKNFPAPNNLIKAAPMMMYSFGLAGIIGGAVAIGLAKENEEILAGIRSITLGIGFGAHFAALASQRLDAGNYLKGKTKK